MLPITADALLQLEQLVEGVEMEGHVLLPQVDMKDTW